MRRPPLPKGEVESRRWARAGERLCCWSSVLPWSVVADDGVEDGEEFSGCCDEGDHLGLSGGDEAVAEGLEGWVVTGGGHGSEEEDGAHGGAASADEAPAAPPPRLPVKGARPASAAILRRSRRPSSGSSARRVRATTGPTPGTETRRSSFSRHSGDPRT